MSYKSIYLNQENSRYKHDEFIPVENMLEMADKEIDQLKYENSVFRELLTSRRLLRKKEGIEQIWVECNWEVLQGSSQ